MDVETAKALEGLTGEERRKKRDQLYRKANKEVRAAAYRAAFEKLKSDPIAYAAHKAYKKQKNKEWRESRRQRNPSQSRPKKMKFRPFVNPDYNKMPELKAKERLSLLNMPDALLPTQFAGILEHFELDDNQVICLKVLEQAMDDYDHNKNRDEIRSWVGGARATITCRHVCESLQKYTQIPYLKFKKMFYLKALEIEEGKPVKMISRSRNIWGRRYYYRGE